MAENIKYPFNSGDYRGWSDPTDALANRLGQYIELYHLPTDNVVAFKAYLTAFTDQYSTDWASEEAFGRMDPIQTYKSTKRTISLGWDVPAGSFYEAKTNLQKASKLLSLLYPTYSKGDGGASTLAAPPLFKLKFMNLIQDSQVGGPRSPARTSGLLGTISGFTYEPDLEAGFFQPTENTKNTSVDGTSYIDGEDRMKLFPKSIKFQCEYTVLHQHRLGWEDGDKKAVTGFGKFPYDSQHDSNSTQAKVTADSPPFSEDQVANARTLNMRDAMAQRNAQIITKANQK